MLPDQTRCLLACLDGEKGLGYGGGWWLVVGCWYRNPRRSFQAKKKMGLFLGLVWFWFGSGFDPVGCSLDRTG